MNGLYGQVTHKDIHGRMVKNGRKSKFQEASSILFKFFEQLKEDSSENMSDKTVVYFFTCSIHCYSFCFGV